MLRAKKKEHTQQIGRQEANEKSTVLFSGQIFKGTVRKSNNDFIKLTWLKKVNGVI